MSDHRYLDENPDVEVLYILKGRGDYDYAIVVRDGQLLMIDTDDGMSRITNTHTKDIVEMAEMIIDWAIRNEIKQAGS